MFDLTFARKSRTGTRVYAERTCAALEALGLCELLPVSDAGYRRWWGARSLWWLQVELARQARMRRADLLHAAAFLGPRRAACPMVVNVLDTTFLVYPNDFDARWQFYARWVIPRTVRQAAAIITLSQHAKSEIVRAYAISPEHVHVIPPGVGAEFHSHHDPARVAETRARYGLSPAYLLFVGEIVPRKNVPTIVRAFAQLAGEFPECTLALVGPRGSGWREVETTIARLGVQNAVRVLGFVPEPDLPRLYAGARAFVFASRLEGFGMPLLEAMASGTVVVSTPNPPVPEIVRDAACLAADATPDALAAALRRVLHDAAYADELRTRGLERARHFTWTRTAQETFAVYQHVMQD